ncbi:hypothetical protein BVRB_9g205880 [Beta vulgaris subsp. vulgaris]|nr:hypothetical protein BVRB_9g205880 [Beta vulgaris subsp. vulgaris]
MMRAIPSNFQHNSSSSNPTPSFHQDISQNFNESQSYHTSVQDSYTDNNSTQPYFGVVGGQGSSNEVLREEDDDVEETHPTTIEPILTPPVVVRSKKKKTPNATTKAAAANMSWSVREEEAVISCYMEHCTDATIGTNQTGAELWRKVFASYELARQSRPHELPERTPNSIRSRWSRMAKDVLKWVGYLEEVARVKKSGQIKTSTTSIGLAIKENQAFIKNIVAAPNGVNYHKVNLKAVHIHPKQQVNQSYQ